MSIQERPGRPKPFRVRIRTPDGRELQRSFERRTDAAKWERDQRVKMDRHEWIDPRLGQTTWNQWAADVLSTRQHLSPKTIEDDTGNVARATKHLAGRPIGAITRADIRKMISALMAHPYSPHTVRSTHKTVRLIFAQAVEDRLIASNPAERPKNLPAPTRDRKIRVFDPEEVETLADAIGRYRFGPVNEETGERPIELVDHPSARYRALVILMAYTGLRIGETLGVKASRIDLLRREVRVADTLVEADGQVRWGRGKTKTAQRVVPFPKSVAEEIAAHIDKYGTGPDGVIFTAPNGGLVRASTFRSRHWKPAVAGTVGEPAVPHDLRHTYAAWLIADGHHPKTIQTLLGHTSIKTTMDVYGHLMSDRDDTSVGLDRRRRAAQARPKPPDGEVVDLRKQA